MELVACRSNAATGTATSSSSKVAGDGTLHTAVNSSTQAKRKFKLLDAELSKLRSKSARLQGSTGAQASRRAMVINNKADALEPDVRGRSRSRSAGNDHKRSKGPEKTTEARRKLRTGPPWD